MTKEHEQETVNVHLGSNFIRFHINCDHHYDSPAWSQIICAGWVNIARLDTSMYKVYTEWILLCSIVIKLLLMS